MVQDRSAFFSISKFDANAVDAKIVNTNTHDSNLLIFMITPHPKATVANGSSLDTI